MNLKVTEKVYIDGHIVLELYAHYFCNILQMYIDFMIKFIYLKCSIYNKDIL